MAHATAGGAGRGCGRSVAPGGETGQAGAVTPPDIAALLRLEVARLRASESHGRFDTVVHLGRLGGAHARCAVSRADLAVLDAGTRTDVVARLLEARPDPAATACAWLTRSGEPTVQDDDLAWLSAATRAYGVLGLRLSDFWTVTRTGWLDVRRGDTRTWKRLRL